MNLLLLFNTENLGFDIESRALGKSYPILKYPTHAKFKSLNFSKQIKLVVLLFVQKQFSIIINYLTECNTHAENFFFFL